MGAGCRYTHENGELAYWLIPNEEDFFDPDSGDYEDLLFENEEMWYFVHDHICNIMTKLGYKQKYVNNQKSKLDYENGLAIVHFDQTYYGDGLVIKIQEKDDTPNMLNLFNANFQNMERKIARALNEFYVLAYATSGYTYHRIEVGQFGKP